MNTSKLIELFENHPSDLTEGSTPARDDALATIFWREQVTLDPAARRIQLPVLGWVPLPDDEAMPKDPDWVALVVAPAEGSFSCELYAGYGNPFADDDSGLLPTRYGTARAAPYVPPTSTSSEIH